MKITEERVAIVTGAARGIGKATALRLSRDGMRVVLSGRDRAALEAVRAEAGSNTGEMYAAPGDLTDSETPVSLVKSAKDRFGRVDVLINAAGIARMLPLLDTDLASWRNFLDVHLTASFLCSQHAARTMITAGSGGAIVNLSSISASMAMYGTGPYATAKGGVSSFTRVFAIELAPYGITVNAIAPGPVATEQLRKVYDATMYRDRSAAIPMKRLAEPEEVADMVAFLVSPAARYITGQILTLDGGASAVGCYSYETYKRQRVTHGEDC